MYGLNVNKAYWDELTQATDSVTLQIRHAKKVWEIPGVCDWC